jgi:organic radical activating enzyme
MPAESDLGVVDRDFASGLLVVIVEALRRVSDGARVAFTTERAIDEDLERWSRFTGHAIVGATREPGGGVRWVLRKGTPDLARDPERAIGERLWLYANFDCNLACDYCCVRSSPRAPRRELGLATIEAIAREAPGAGVREIFLTGGEPFLLPDIAEVLHACAAAAATTVLTNGMLFAGKRRDALARMPRERVTLQVSLDSPDPELHDRHRGAGTWEKAWRGAVIARELGFRVRLAATVADERAEERMTAFLDRERVASEDRVVRRVALRGFAQDGVALARTDLVPEVTLTASGVYWHPVGADDDDFFVQGAPLPLRDAIASVALAYEEERRFANTLATIFRCA